MAHIRSKKAIHRNWFLTEKGRNVALFAATSTSCAAVLGHVLPHTILLGKCRDFVRLYSNGSVVPVPDTLAQKFDKTLDLLKIDAHQKPRYLPFMACGFDMFSFGTFGRFGVHIGLPVNFQYNSEESIDKSKILINQATVIWESDAGKQLLSALVMSDEAQSFAIAREIKMRDSWKLFLDAGFAFFGCGLTYFESMIINKRLDMFNKPRQLRYLGYSLVVLFNLTSYVMCKDLNQNMYEEKVDKELKELNPVFAEGGRQFYSHILERNKALRELMGKEGEAMYTVLGNENFLLRNKHAPIVQRLSFFQGATDNTA